MARKSEISQLDLTQILSLKWFEQIKNLNFFFFFQYHAFQLPSQFELLFLASFFSFKAVTSSDNILYLDSY